ncbi:Nmad3 family putative nucleotide modification protein [Lysinibacillus capsici]
MKGLGINLYSEAHLDPDLQKSIKKERPENWRGLFGQSGTSQGTLYNRNVGKGDIFLFFGWFKKAEKKNGVWKYCATAPNVHAIFGYLEVDEVLDIKGGDSVPSWTKYHPHISKKREYGKKRNTVYIATRNFSTDIERPGWGTFIYDEKLILTKPNSTSKSFWEIAPCFKGERNQFTHNIKIWNELSNGRIEMQTYGRGDQEIYISSNPEVVSWAEDLISTCKIYE